MDFSPSVQRFKMLVVSDIHMHLENMKKLQQWALENPNHEINAILAPGDFDTLSSYHKDLNCEEYLQSQGKFFSFSQKF